MRARRGVGFEFFCGRGCFFFVLASVMEEKRNVCVKSKSKWFGVLDNGYLYTKILVLFQI